MNIGVELLNIADVELLTGARHDLHNANGADVATHRLIKPRFLIPLSGHQQPVNIVAIAIFAKDLHHGQKFTPFFLPRRVFNVAGILQVAQQYRITQPAALAILIDERIKQGQQLRAIVTYRPTDITFVAQNNVLMNLNPGKTCFQNRALWRSTTINGIRPALSISIRSSSSSASGAGSMVMGAAIAAQSVR